MQVGFGTINLNFISQIVYLYILIHIFQAHGQGGGARGARNQKGLPDGIVKDLK